MISTREICTRCGTEGDFLGTALCDNCYLAIEHQPVKTAPISPQKQNITLIECGHMLYSLEFHWDEMQERAVCGWCAGARNEHEPLCRLRLLLDKFDKEVFKQ